jgi:polar amino acid transport system permease protein
MLKDYTESNTFKKLRDTSGRVPLIRQPVFLIASCVALVLYGSMLFWASGEGLVVRIALSVFVALLVTWTGIIITDERRGERLKTSMVFLVLAVLVLLFLEFHVTNSEEIIELFFNITVIKKAWPYLVLGFKTTISLAFMAALVSTVIGLTLAIFRSFDNKVLNFFIIAYVDFFRAIPIIVLLMLIYYGLPFLNIRLSAFASGVLGLGLNSGAYVSEIFRAGFLSVSKGQLEASRALGMTPWQTMQKVALPQAFKAVIPPLVGNYVASAKDTALCSSISIIELLKAGTAQQSLNANPSPLIFVTVLYLILFVPLTRLCGYIEKRMKKTQRQITV